MAACLINPLFNALLIKGHTMIQVAGDPCGFFGAPMAIMFFCLLYETEIGCAGVRKAVESIARLSLDMYLCSYAFDAWLYPLFKARYYENQSQFGWYFFVLVPLVLAGAYGVSWMKTLMFRYGRLACRFLGKLGGAK